MIINFISKSLEFIEQLIYDNIAGVICAQTQCEAESQRHSHTQNFFCFQILVLLDYQFQFSITFREGYEAACLQAKALGQRSSSMAFAPPGMLSLARHM